jgi:hypothetical protein
MTLVVQHHHERYDGSGYPSGLVRDDIPMLGRIAGIVDSYDAMTNDRVYAKGRSCLEAIKELYELRDIQFQGELIEQFIQALGIYPVGTLVELNSGEVAVVVGINRLRRLQPKVMLLLDAEKSSLKDNLIIHLAEQPIEDDSAARSIGQSLPPGAFDISPDDYYL